MEQPRLPAQRSLIRRFQPLLMATAAVAIIMSAVSVIIGLNPLFVVPIVMLFAIVLGFLLRFRSRRTSNDSSSLSALGFLSLVTVSTVLVLIQAVPYGRSHTNPPVVAEPRWPDAQTRALAVRACYDCHSNEVKYPWYSNIAPISWLVSEHVNDGRAALNFSDIGRASEGKENAIEVIQDGSMPPSYFTRFGLHHSAKLSKAEANALIAGLQKMPAFRGN